MPTAAKKANARGATPAEAVSNLAEVTDRVHGLLVERADADGDREAVLMSWGLVLPERDKAPRRVTNVRNDKILESCAPQAGALLVRDEALREAPKR